MASPDVEQFVILLENPESLFEKVKEQFQIPEGKHSEFSEAELGSITSNEGLFSRLEAQLTLYYPSPEKQKNGFILFAKANFSTQEYGCWSNSEISRLQVLLKKKCLGQHVAYTETCKQSAPQLFIFDRDLGVRLHTMLGYKNNPSYHPRITFSAYFALDAGTTRSLQGTPDNIITFDRRDDFVRKIQTGTLLIARVINSMLDIKKKSQPQTLVLARPNSFDFIRMTY